MARILGRSKLSGGQARKWAYPKETGAGKKNEESKVLKMK